MHILDLRLATNRLSDIRDFYVNMLEFPLLHESRAPLTLGAGEIGWRSSRATRLSIMSCSTFPKTGLWKQNGGRRSAYPC